MASTTPKQKKVKTTCFDPRWPLEYGIEVTSKDRCTGKPTGAVCLFCKAFTRADEAINDGTRTRKRTGKTMLYTNSKSDWRSDTFLNHNKRMHTNKWTEYRSLSLQQKKMYFNEGLRRNTNIATFRNEITDATPTRVLVEKTIVHNIVLRLLADKDTSNDAAVPVTVESLGMEPFYEDDGSPSDCYCYIIKNQLQADTVLASVAAGLSFSQVAEVADHYRRRCNLQNQMGPISRKQVSRDIRLFCAEAFTVIAYGLRECWAFSIALDGGNKSTVPYLDFRVRFVLAATMYNLHLIAAPMHEAHTGDNMFALTSSILDTLCPTWKNKIIGVTTDGASNMVGRHVGVVTQIQRAALPGFYRVWCAAHQLDLVVQAQFKKMYNEKFIQFLQGVTGYLRRQRFKGNGTASPCPTFVETRWLSMGKVLEWLVKHRLSVLAYFEAHQYQCKPPIEWWIEVYILNDVVIIINETFTRLQGQQLVLEQQMKELESLQSKLMVKGQVLEKTLDFVDMMEGQIEVGNFVMTSLESAETYLYDLGSSDIVRVAMRQKEANEEEHKNLLKRICSLYLHLVSGIYLLSPERNDGNASVERHAPYSMPHAVAEGGSRKFLALVAEQNERLLCFSTDEEVALIEGDYAAFHSKYRLDRAFCELVNETDNAKSFSDAWKWLYDDFPRLVTFCGGLATIFPGTSTVESDFSVIGWEKDAHRSRLYNLSLEGILHSKQRAELYRLGDHIEDLDVE